MRETGGHELASTITLVLQANRLTKDIQVVRIAESLRAENVINKRKKFGKVAGSRNDCKVRQMF